MGLKYLTRVDTGEVIDTRVVTESDSQLYFDLGDEAETMTKAEPRDITPPAQIEGQTGPLMTEGSAMTDSDPGAADPEVPVQ